MGSPLSRWIDPACGRLTGAIHPELLGPKDVLERHPSPLSGCRGRQTGAYAYRHRRCSNRNAHPGKLTAYLRPSTHGQAYQATASAGPSDASSARSRPSHARTDLEYPTPVSFSAFDPIRSQPQHNCRPARMHPTAERPKLITSNQPQRRPTLNNTRLLLVSQPVRLRWRRVRRSTVLTRPAKTR